MVESLDEEERATLSTRGGATLGTRCTFADPPVGGLGWGIWKEKVAKVGSGMGKVAKGWVGW